MKKLSQSWDYDLRRPVQLIEHVLCLCVPWSLEGRRQAGADGLAAQPPDGASQEQPVLYDPTEGGRKRVFQVDSFLQHIMCPALAPTTSPPLFSENLFSLSRFTPLWPVALQTSALTQMNSHARTTVIRPQNFID